MRRVILVVGIVLVASLVVPEAWGQRRPDVAVSPDAARPGQLLTVTGTGFHPHRRVRLAISGDAITTAVTSRSGVLTATLELPTALDAGPVQLRVTQSRPRRVAVAPLMVLPAESEASEWTMDRGSPGGAGVNAAERTLTLASVDGVGLGWERAVDLHLYAPPVVADGVVFAGSAGARYDDGAMSAYAADDGTPLWRTELPGSVTVSPAVADGVVVAADTFGHLTAMSSDDGAVLWSFPLDLTQGLNAPVTIDDDTVYVGVGTTLQARDLRTGSLRWVSDPQGGDVYTAPAVVDGVVYVVPTNGVSALDAATGESLWDLSAAGLGVYGAPAVVEGVVYLEASAPLGQQDRGAVYAVDATDGQVLWAQPQQASGVASPSVADGVVYAALANGDIVALDAASGTERWRHTLPGRVYYSSPVLAGGALYIGAADSAVHVLDPASGAETRSLPAPGGDSARPVVAEAHLFLASESGMLRSYAP